MERADAVLAQARQAGADLARVDRKEARALSPQRPSLTRVPLRAMRRAKFGANDTEEGFLISRRAMRVCGMLFGLFALCATTAAVLIHNELALRDTEVALGSVRLLKEKRMSFEGRARYIDEMRGAHARMFKVLLVMQRHLRQEARAQSVLGDTHEQLRKLASQHQDRVKGLLAGMGHMHDAKVTARLKNVTASFQEPVAQIMRMAQRGLRDGDKQARKRLGRATQHILNDLKSAAEDEMAQEAEIHGMAQHDAVVGSWDRQRRRNSAKRPRSQDEADIEDMMLALETRLKRVDPAHLLDAADAQHGEELIKQVAAARLMDTGASKPTAAENTAFIAMRGMLSAANVALPGGANVPGSDAEDLVLTKFEELVYNSRFAILRAPVLKMLAAWHSGDISTIKFLLSLEQLVEKHNVSIETLLAAEDLDGKAKASGGGVNKGATATEQQSGRESERERQAAEHALLTTGW